MGAIVIVKSGFVRSINLVLCNEFRVNVVINLPSSPVIDNRRLLFTQCFQSQTSKVMILQITPIVMFDHV